MKKEKVVMRRLPHGLAGNRSDSVLFNLSNFVTAGVIFAYLAVKMAIGKTRIA